MKRKTKLCFDPEVQALFESTSGNSPSEFKIGEQRFTVETAFGEIECKCNLQGAVDVLDHFFSSLFYEAYEKEIEDFERRTQWEGDYLKDAGLQSILALRRKTLETVMPHAIKLLEKQLPGAIRESVESLITGVKEQTLRELDGQTPLPSVDTQAMRERLMQLWKGALRERIESPKRGRPRIDEAKFKSRIERALKKIDETKGIKKKLANELGLTAGALRNRCTNHKINLNEMIKAHKNNLISVR